jgi:hypothetical protein
MCKGSGRREVLWLLYRARVEGRDAERAAEAKWATQ